MSFELYIPPERPTHNKVNGHFLKGNIPFNKGKSWNEWATKEGQERMRVGWKNLTKPHKRPDVIKRIARPVVAIVNGRAKYFSSIVLGARWCGGGKPGISRCCRLNLNPQPNKRNGKLNTDNTYMGYRWYYESDEQWMKKIL